MYFELKIQNFRNHKSFFLEFENNLFIEGNNGTGKTSLLEAIHVSKQLKSFRTVSLKQIINSKEKNFQIKFKEKNNNIKEINIFFNKKISVKMNNETIKNSVNHILNNPVLTYSPENEGFLSKNLNQRRNILDKIIFYENPIHIENLKQYNKIIKLKSSYLKSNNKDNTYLESLNEKIINVSDKIIKNRKKMIKKINIALSKFSEKKEISINGFHLNYFCNEIKKNNFDEEKKLKKITQGPHLDKIRIYKENKEIEKMLSFGQKKTIAVICMLSSFLSIEEKLKDDIIFLLDDFETGLDKKSVIFFKNIFSNYHYVITGVKNNYFKEIKTIGL
jgi:DNA replication and repair protein RecF